MIGSRARTSVERAGSHSSIVSIGVRLGEGYIMQALYTLLVLAPLFMCPVQVCCMMPDPKP